MRILSMRATFGKLEHQTLNLTPGLNVVEAPNEWGKSTWCAFLIAMLYGIDTRSKSSKTQMTDRERYAPWSGASMEGSMDLIWKGRRITIQRSTSGRIPMGDFRAFETETGLDIPELTGENCGLQLLGVEKAVFSRSAFLRLSDLPVTDHEQLRSRLNALVSTGDESGNAQRLEQKLKELKHRCRYNRTGLLPQAHQHKQELENSIRQYQLLVERETKLSARIEEMEAHLSSLNNHKAILEKQQSMLNEDQLRRAQQAVTQAQAEMEELEAQCQLCPSQEEAYRHIVQLSHLRQVLDAIEMEEAMIPSLPSPPEPPAGFENCPPQTAVLQAETHRKQLTDTQSSKWNIPLIFFCLTAVFLPLAAYLLLVEETTWFFVPLYCGLLSLVFCGITAVIRKKRHCHFQSCLFRLSQQYGSSDPEQWVRDAHDYVEAWENYKRYKDACVRLRGDLDDRKASALQSAMDISHSKGIDVAMEHWQAIAQLWEAHGDTQRQLIQSQKHLQSFSNRTTDPCPPETPDALSFTMDETLRLISDANHELRQLLSNLGQCQGQIESLGNIHELKRQHQELESRIRKLEQTYQALDCAQKALEEATLQLQRRFAPRITQSTKKLFSQLTGGRYNRVQISQDLNLEIAAQDEDVLRSQRWRSNGTVDQLYLAMRLAVAAELMPEGPVILDDALVRFDDQRLKAALALLEDQATHRQVILFTCQGRERQLMEKAP